jgi:hypothetical protein
MMGDIFGIYCIVVFLTLVSAVVAMINGAHLGLLMVQWMEIAAFLVITPFAIFGGMQLNKWLFQRGK